MPYLGFSGPGSQFSPFAGGTNMKGVHLDEVKALDNYHAAVYKGTKDVWLTQLLSPALLEWLSRSEDDFGFELANGVLCVGHSSHLAQQAELEAVWTDADYLAAAIRKESIEEVEGGDEGPGLSAKALDAYVERLEETITAPSKT